MTSTAKVSDPQSLLQPGDILLFDRSGFFSWLIKFERGEKYSHVEVFVGDGKTVASRNGIGVNEYPIDLTGLAAIYRVKPRAGLNLQQGLAWFFSKSLGIQGQGYDWVGLLSFKFAKLQGKDNHKMFCSEFVMRFMRACGVELFSQETDADAVSPGMIPYSQSVEEIWLRPDKVSVHED